MNGTAKVVRVKLWLGVVGDVTQLNSVGTCKSGDSEKGGKTQARFNKIGFLVIMAIAGLITYNICGVAGSSTETILIFDVGRHNHTWPSDAGVEEYTESERVSEGRNCGQQFRSPYFFAGIIGEALTFTSVGIIVVTAVVQVTWKIGKISSRLKRLKERTDNLIERIDKIDKVEEALKQNQNSTDNKVADLLNGLHQLERKLDRHKIEHRNKEILSLMQKPDGRHKKGAG
jgi:hypothetical protein